MPIHGKDFPYSLPSVGPGADPGVQTVSPQVSHPPGGRLPLLSDRPAVIFPAAEHHRILAGTKLYCLVTEAHRCEQIAQSCYTAFAPSIGFKPTTCWSHVQRSTRCAIATPTYMYLSNDPLADQFFQNVLDRSSPNFQHIVYLSWKLGRPLNIDSVHSEIIGL